MRIKQILLSLLLVLPILIISFLYIFGQNRYEVEPKKVFREVSTERITSLINFTPIVTLVCLSTPENTPVGMQMRVVNRINRLQKEGGKIRLVTLAQALNSGTPIAKINEFRLCNKDQIDSILHQDLHLRTDTGGLGYWYLLLDTKGKLLNAYDLRQERLLDTLAIEATIMAEQQL